MVGPQLHHQVTLHALHLLRRHLPLQLRLLRQLEGSVLCVNPGRLTKGTSAGTFVHVHIHPATDGAADGAELAARTRVEVLRV